MELNLSNDEVVDILLEWAKAQFKNQTDFNTVNMDTGYGTLRKITISHVAEKPLVDAAGEA